MRCDINNPDRYKVGARDCLSRAFLALTRQFTLQYSLSDRVTTIAF